MVSSCLGWPADGWSWTWAIIDCFFSFSVGFGSAFAVVMVSLRNLLGRITVMLWLSSFPWSTPGGCDRVSAGIFNFPGICCIS